MKNNAYFTVDNLRYMTIPSSFGDSYYLKKDSDKYKSMLKSAKQVGKKDWFVNVMKIRETFLSALTDLVIENSKNIPENLSEFKLGYLLILLNMSQLIILP
ncbi:hypothetical protein [Pedobacter sp.]|uniref:hypothetical protein n=1 Tax=Pedobacter sp. TaxID=1411316 RepID=UPI0031DF3B62